MRRTGRVIFLIFVLIGCMALLWMVFSWKMKKQDWQKETWKNVYILSCRETQIQMLKGKEKKTRECVTAVSKEIQGMADVYLQAGKIVKIIHKPITIQGKILQVSGQNITLKDYGKISYTEDFRVYKKQQNGDIIIGTKEDLQVGMAKCDFYVEGNRLCGVMIPDTTETSTNIRVLLHNKDYSSYEMEQVVVSANTDYKVQNVSYKKGEKVTITPEMAKETIIVTTENKGKIRIENSQRKYGVPEYRGEIEVHPKDGKLYLINEVSLEEYLYSVVPSEMPTSYNPEALKAQAVCARSYAVSQMEGTELAEYGAHVDDSVSYQMYNNFSEDKSSIAAVNATKEKVVKYKGKIAATYFFSSSCGMTSGTKAVWFTGKETSYLPTGAQTSTREKKDMSVEEVFTEYIKSEPESLDSNSPWFRWKTSVTPKNIENSIEKKLSQRYLANPSQIQVKQKDGSFQSEVVENVGAVTDVQVVERGESGVISTLDIIGTEKTIRVYTEYNVRSLLGNEEISIIRKDKSEVSGLSLLPSGFFIIEKKGDNYEITGGGYGHGVGMSQNGADTLGKQGKSYEEILKFYFPGTDVQSS